MLWSEKKKRDLVTGLFEQDTSLLRQKEGYGTIEWEERASIGLLHEMSVRPMASWCQKFKIIRVIIYYHLSLYLNIQASRTAHTIYISSAFFHRIVAIPSRTPGGWPND